MINDSDKEIVKITLAAAGALSLVVGALEYFGVYNSSIHGQNGLLIGLLICLIVGLTAPKLLSKREYKEITICLFDELLIYLPYFIALDKGFFKKQGINVKHISGGGDEKTWTKVDNGEADFGISDPTIFCKAKSKNGKLIGLLVNKAALWGVSPHSNRVFNSEEDVDGIDGIAGYKPPSTTFQYLSIISKASSITKTKQIDPGREIEFVTKNPSFLTLLAEPFVSEIKSQNSSINFNGPRIFGNVAYSGVYCKSEYINNNPKIVYKVILCLQQALNLIRQDPLEALEIADRSFPGFDRLTLYKAVIRMLDDEIFPENITPRSADWQAAIELWALPPNQCKYNESVIGTFAEKAYQATNK